MRLSLEQHYRNSDSGADADVADEDRRQGNAVTLAWNFLMAEVTLPF